MLYYTESNGKLPQLFIPSNTATLVPEFAVRDLPLGRTLWWWYANNFLEIYRLKIVEPWTLENGVPKWRNWNISDVLFSWKFGLQMKAVCWLDVKLKEKNSILDRDLNRGL